jgi:hypothetical protein
MGNAHVRESQQVSCGTQRCGKIVPPTAKKQEANNNLVTSVRAIEEITTTRTQPSRGKTVLKTIKATLKDIFDPPEPERLPPKRFPPKQLLYGCTTADEHFDYIDEVCEKVANLRGREGLELMGFDFRIVHHSKNCECPGVEHEEDDLTDSELDPEEMKEGYMESSEEGDDFGQFEEESDSEQKTDAQMFMVPIGSPLKIPEDKLSEIAELSNGTNFHVQTSPYTSANISRNTSTLSLFSLATHNTEFSNPTADGSRRMMSGGSRRASGRFPLSSIASSPNVFVMEQDSCALRLHHTSTNTVVTAENHNTYLADGKFYDELARLCMEHAQEVMMEEAGMEWVTIQEEPKYGAIVTKGFFENRKTARDNNAKHRTLLVVTGKGQVEAGMFSRRHLLVTSMEAATALPFVREAQHRHMDIVMLDPNALGSRHGMDVVEKSLEHFFMGQNSLTEDEEVYILAHSMAGAQIVRFFIDNSSCHRKPPPAPSSASSSVSDASSNVSNGTSNGSTAATDNSSVVDRKAQRTFFLEKVKAFAFTDSNHNINWVKNHPKLRHALTGPPSLYIKSHKVHEKAKELGEAHHDCQFWRHRFGEIKTLWAGTHEHALTNYTSRAHIWEHFDQFLKDEPSQLNQESQPIAAGS